jgi:putative ABC transport system permease protein
MRMLLKRPGFTFIAIITLTLGIGANTAIFSVVQTVLLRPLPFNEEGLVVAWKNDETSDHTFVELSIPEFNEWQSQSQVFEHLAAMTTSVYGFGYTLVGREEPVKIQSARVSSDFFATFGVSPKLGRAFTADEDRPGATGTAVISHHLWQSQFNSDPKLIGQIITLNDGGTQASLEAAVSPGAAGQPIALKDTGLMVIGVMPPEFDFPHGIDMWVPLSATSGKALVESRIGFLQAVGRLKPSMTLEQAQAELDTIISRIAAEHPELRASNERSVIKPLASHIFGDAQPALYLLLAATALLLAVACANIANLLLARATSRRKEIALRAALGASRMRLVRQLMSESLMLAIVGGALGILLAYWLIDLLVELVPADIPRIGAVEINVNVLLFTCGITLLAALVFGLAPALTVSKVHLNEALNASSSRAGSETRGNKLRGVLVVAQMAIALVLLIGAGLIFQSLLNLRQVDLGFNPHNVLTFQIQLHGDKYPQVDKTRDYFQQLIERLEAQPGVVAAGATVIRPLAGPVGSFARYATEGQTSDEIMRNPILNCEAITPHYLRAAGIQLKAGREFTEQDNATGTKVILISETMARSMFATGDDPVGKRINVGGQGWCNIVGIVGDARLRELKDDHWNVYLPYRQYASPVTYVSVRTASDPALFVGMVRREVAAIDPEQLIMNVMTMDEVVANALARPSFNALLLNMLSMLAALLAAVGIYGVVSYSVTQRTHEIGIRIALGATASDVLRLVVRQGMLMALVGIGAGIIGAFALTRLISSLLFDVTATDPLTFAMVAVLLAIVALIACFVPARRATKVDPMVALRYE